MEKLYKYPSIEQFRSVVKNVKDYVSFDGVDESGKRKYKSYVDMPVITFKGTVKLHGTNAAIALDSEGNYWCQSRERILSLTQDNAGFYVFANKNKDWFETKLKNILKRTGADSVIVYGEFAGNGIQKGVGISEIEKSFFVFGVKFVCDNIEMWGESFIEEFNCPDISLYNTNMFKTYSIDIDFSEPEESVNQMVKWVEEVENQCPVAKYFGIDGIGEGIVFSAKYYDIVLKFKVKGEKHQSSKVKTLAPVDVEVIKKINEFVEYSVTNSRLEQGISVMRENNIETNKENISSFIKWVVSDVMKEESDVIVSNGLDAKKVTGAIGKSAAEYYKKTFF